MTNKLAKQQEEFGTALYHAALESRKKKITDHVVTQVEHWMQSKHAAEIIIRKQQLFVDELAFRLAEVEAGRFDLDPETGVLTLHNKFNAE